MGVFGSGKFTLVAAAFCLCWLLAECKHECNFPPDLWCSSKQIARDCQVEDQCKNNVWLKCSQASKVNLTLYYETLCSDCKDFTAEQLWPTFVKIADIFNLELVPYGNAREEQVGGQWRFSCQHGPVECLGNLIQTCALHIVGNVSKAFPFISCMEASHLAPNVSGPQCAKDKGVDYSAVLGCMSSKLGNELQHQMAVKTDLLNPPHEYVPWITLNGVHTEDIQKKANDNLLKLLCDTYKGEKPAACDQESLVRKCAKVQTRQNLL